MSKLPPKASSKSEPGYAISTGSLYSDLSVNMAVGPISKLGGMLSQWEC